MQKAEHREMLGFFVATSACYVSVLRRDLEPRRSYAAD